MAPDVFDRQPKFIFPSTLDNRRQGHDVVGLELVSALRCRFPPGRSDGGRDITLFETNANRLVPAADRAKEGLTDFLGYDDIFGE